jgi:hypothetical protein
MKNTFVLLKETYNVQQSEGPGYSEEIFHEEHAGHTNILKSYNLTRIMLEVTKLNMEVCSNHDDHW